MVLMALVTTAMTGPLLRLIYPPRLVERDIADAERAALAVGAAYRVLVVVESGDDTEVVDTAIDLAAAHAPAQVLLVRLLPQTPDRSARGRLRARQRTARDDADARRAARARRAGSRPRRRGAACTRSSARTRRRDLTRLIMEVEPDLVLLGARHAARAAQLHAAHRPAAQRAARAARRRLRCCSAAAAPMSRPRCRSRLSSPSSRGVGAGPRRGPRPARARHRRRSGPARCRRVVPAR